MIKSSKMNSVKEFIFDEIVTLYDDIDSGFLAFFLESILIYLKLFCRYFDLGFRVDAFECVFSNFGEFFGSYGKCS